MNELVPSKEKVEQLRDLRVRLKSGEYSGTDIMQAWIVLGEYADALERTASEPPAEPDQPAVIQAVAVKNGRACVIGIPAYYSKLPEDHPWQHSCDANGCTSVEHMLWRGPVQDESTAPPPGLWQPIETMPSVKRVLVYVPIDNHRMVIAYKQQQGVILDEQLKPMAFPPSHWRHLPSPPTKGGEHG